MSAKHSVRDAFVWLVSVLGVSARYRARMRKHGPLVRVLCFHDVPDRQWFERIVDALVSECKLLTPAELHEGRFDTDCINVLFTFDDGYSSWVETVLPVLNARGLTGLFFISSGLLDAARDEEAAARFMRERLWIRPRRPLTWDGARTLRDAGHTIGGHTISHPRLSELDEAELREEIAEDRAALEAKLDTTLVDFAYPFGTPSDHTDAARTVAEQAGYTHIYTAESGFMGPSATHIPRTLIEERQSPSSVIRWVRGGYDVFGACKNFFQ